MFVVKILKVGFRLGKEKSFLPDGELNPGLPRDRRGSLPLDYQGLDALNRKLICFLYNFLSMPKKMYYMLSLSPIEWELMNIKKILSK